MEFRSAASPQPRVRPGFSTIAANECVANVVWLFTLTDKKYAVIVASIVDVYADYSGRNLSQINSLFWTIQFVPASHAFVDCLLAAIMCYYLQKSRAGPGFSRVDSTVVKLMQYIIGSGVATAACAIATLIALTVRPNGLLWTVFHYSLSKLYINSYLALLNARQHLRKRMEGSSSLMSPSDVRFVGHESYIQDFPSGSTDSHHSKNAKAGPSLVILNDTPISEGFPEDKKVMVSTSLIV
ncbi:hypothetical protein PILCRDRAFT_669842 [Piloderma croceum F 1598]|uniref:DUF6534 domain-containing protein n=1 Tax=Piloderma croceum (strain F 1598) TaxID=765440 RepID=A0A0C3BE46_PILCF|nr:hypothetical protein PILCRDRAFT_669842 [Piloderma croceum F 1598]